MVEDFLRWPAVVNSPGPILARLTWAPYTGLRPKGRMEGLMLNGGPPGFEPGCLAPHRITMRPFSPQPGCIANAIIRRYASEVNSFRGHHKNIGAPVGRSRNFETNRVTFGMRIRGGDSIIRRQDPAAGPSGRAGITGPAPGRPCSAGWRAGGRLWLRQSTHAPGGWFLNPPDFIWENGGVENHRDPSVNSRSY